LVSKGFIRRGYIPHRWLQKNGVPFEKIIWASGGNVAKEILEGKSLNIAVVSINKNKTARKKFANFFDRKYLVPNEYSGSALLACELGGILKNYYAGLGRYLWIKYGDKVLDKYKITVRKEFRRAVRSVSGSPIVSVRGWVIRKASHGPAFWEDLDVTIRDGRNGLFGEAVLSGASVAETLEDLGLVESFNTIFSTISLFNRLRGKVLNRLPILKSILEIYENLYLQHIDSGDAKIDDEVKSLIEEVEKKILS
jgi:glycerol-3-phosphate dehydrogenase